MKGENDNTEDQCAVLIINRTFVLLFIPHLQMSIASTSTRSYVIGYLACRMDCSSRLDFF